MGWVGDSKQRLNNSLKIVHQIRRGEWEFRINPLSRESLTAHKDGLELWVGNGAWFCEIRGTNRYFGFIFRHYVWHAAAAAAKRKADKAWRKESLVVPRL